MCARECCYCWHHPVRHHDRRSGRRRQPWKMRAFSASSPLGSVFWPRRWQVLRNMLEGRLYKQKCRPSFFSLCCSKSCEVVMLPALWCLDAAVAAVFPVRTGAPLIAHHCAPQIHIVTSSGLAAALISAYCGQIALIACFAVVLYLRNGYRWRSKLEQITREATLLSL